MTALVNIPTTNRLGILLPHLHQHLPLFDFWIINLEWNLTRVFIWVSLMPSDPENFSCVLGRFKFHNWKQLPIHALGPFLNWIVSFVVVELLDLFIVPGYSSCFSCIVCYSRLLFPWPELPSNVALHGQWLFWSWV